MTVYLIKLRIVKITVVVTVDVDVCSVGGGGSTAPGEWSIPANAETVSIRLSARIAPLLRNVFIVWSSEVIRNFCINKQTGDTKFLINLELSQHSRCYLLMRALLGVNWHRLLMMKT